ncbi:MAG TPA: molybdopterin dinucleotide binding domain-containing protein, partial [Thermoanaerobaculia bacterium]
LRARAAEYDPSRVARITGLSEASVVSLGERYGRSKAAFIRVNYGLQRHAGGGSAVRAISILPAVTGAWDEVGGGATLSTSGTFSALDTATLQRKDLIRPGTRTINMSRLGEALTKTDDPPVKALVVYNSNPGAVAPDRENVTAGLRREDLFTVVLEHFQTDTADYADVLLPATTQLEHEDLHKAYGHTYVMFNARSIAPIGESLPNSEIFRRIAARMNLDFPELRESDEEMMRQTLRTMPFTLDDLREQSYIRLNIPKPHLPFARGSTLPTPSGKIEIDSARAAAEGLDRLPDYVPPYESEERDPELVRRYPLALISPPAHSFLNSTFVNVASLRRAAGKPTLEIHADDARTRNIAEGARVSIFNDRGAFTAEAVITDRVRPGVVSAPSIWWPKTTADRTNANHTTSQAITDIGGGATFYDNQVDVRSLA